MSRNEGEGVIELPEAVHSTRSGKPSEPSLSSICN